MIFTKPVNQVGARLDRERELWYIDEYFRKEEKRSNMKDPKVFFLGEREVVGKGEAYVIRLEENGKPKAYTHAEILNWLPKDANFAKLFSGELQLFGPVNVGIVLET